MTSYTIHPEKPNAWGDTLPQMPDGYMPPDPIPPLEFTDCTWWGYKDFPSCREGDKLQSASPPAHFPQCPDCPPCNGNCRQGDTCTAVEKLDDDADDWRPWRMSGLAWFAASAIVGMVATAVFFAVGVIP